MWLGEQITERGSATEFPSSFLRDIAAGLPSAIGGTLELVRNRVDAFPGGLGIFVAATVVTGFVVFVERGQRKILVNYASARSGERFMAAELPSALKAQYGRSDTSNFASSIILFPATLAGWFSSGESMSWLKDISNALSPGQPIYVIMYAAMIVFFCFFYTALVFNPKETAEILKKSGAFIPGIRPGEQTARILSESCYGLPSRGRFM